MERSYIQFMTPPSKTNLCQLYNVMYTHRYLEECGGELVTLRLACCKYIGEKTMSTIGRVCTKVEGLLKETHGKTRENE